VQLLPTPWRCAAFPVLSDTGFQPCSRHANQGGQNEENLMTIINFALLLNALAHLFSALAKLVAAARHRRKRR
jgi:hypothetical protein